MAMPKPQESAENKYLGYRMLFKLKNQRWYMNIWKNITMKRMPCLREVGP